MEWKESLPMDIAPKGDDENDFVYDDGQVWFFCTAIDGRLVIHDFAARDVGLRGARTGIGRQACARVRPHFSEIVAGGVGEYLDGIPIEEQKPFLFWKTMLDEGLIDEIVPIYGDSVFRSEAPHKAAR